MNRISTGYQYDVSQGRILKAGQNYFDAQQRVTTGKRINEMSDDPLGFTNVVSMRSVQSSLNQFSTNLNRANNALSSTEGVFAEVNTLMQRANSLAVSGATATTGPEVRKAIADEVGTIRDRLLQLANTKGANGDYIFSGTKIDTVPFSLTSTGIVYNGDTNPVRVEAAPGELMSISTNGQQLFTDAYTRLDNLKLAIEGGNQSQVSDQGIKDMQASLSEFNTARGDVGTRMKSVENWKADHARRTEELTQSVSDIEGVDMTQAILEYKTAETAYQAALQVASQGFRLSLMDFIQ